MDRPCMSSWTEAHEKFQAREYDAGASPTSSEPAWKRRIAGQAPAKFLKFPWNCCAILNEVIKMKCTCIM
jgi:hypothetical protein